MRPTPHQPPRPFCRLPELARAGRLACLWAVAVGIAAGGLGDTAAAVPWYEGFEGPAVSWRDAGGDAHYRIAQHRRVAGEAHTGRGAERLVGEGQGGTQVLIAHDVGRPSVIDELRPSVWVRADRPGLQILAEVTLPRSRDPRTGQPVRTLLAGTSYTEVGRWQPLRLDGLPSLLARQVLALRGQLGPQVDAGGAYVERILLNVYGGPGVTNVWIDDLDVPGHVSLAPPPAQGQPVAPPAGAPMAPSRATSPAPRRIQLSGPMLHVDGQPVFLRAIEHQGESLAHLKALGFNAVWLKRPASQAILEEALREGLLVVCPPPAEAVAPAPANPLGAPAPQIGPVYAAVAAWDLGWGFSEQDMPAVRERARQIRKADQAAGRPLIAHAEADLRGLIRYVDLLVVGQSPLGTSLELADYGVWIRERPRLARPGTTVWCTVQTEPSWALQQQWLASGRGRSPPPEIASEQIRFVAYAAIAAGGRGLLFESSRSLEANDPATQARAAALEFLNLELALIDSWLAQGSLVETIDSSEKDVGGIVFRHGRSRLLVPTWVGQGAQYVPGQSASDTVRFIVPTGPNAARAYELAPGPLRPILEPLRKPGGVEVVLAEFSLGSLVFFTEDARTVDRLGKRAEAIAPRAAELHRQLAARKLSVVDEVAQYLVRRGDGAWRPGGHVDAARKHLAECDAALAARDFGRARLQAERAMRRLRIVERAHWQAAVARLRSPISSPATLGFSTLPWHWSLSDDARSWQAGPELLVGGDFESVGALTGSGWQLFQHETSGMEIRADVIPEASHTGAAGLRLTARAVSPEASQALVETPPVWFTTPPLPVQSGQMVQIHGWVHVPTPITGSVDGLLIFDSMSGRALAERIGDTTDWQSFTLFRVATQTGPMRVTFALAGRGEVWIDDVSVRVLGPGTLAERPGAR